MRKNSNNNLIQYVPKCGQPFYKSKSKQKASKSGLHFCCCQCKDEAQRLGGIEAIMPSHYGQGDGEHTYRDQFNEDELVCARCDYDEFICSVEIHHIDGDRTNNAKENLLPLCCCCHSALHKNQWGLDEILDGL